jgi:hypothetical protein
MKEIKDTILYSASFCDSILLRFQNRNYGSGSVPLKSVINLQFQFQLRFRFRNTDSNP